MIYGKHRETRPAGDIEQGHKKPIGYYSLILAMLLIELGAYTGCSTTYYASRVTYSPGTGWVALNQNGAPQRSVGWHLFKVVLKSTTADFYVDGVLGAANRAYSSSQGNVSFEEIRVGSGYASTSGAAYYDDVLLQKGQ